VQSPVSPLVRWALDPAVVHLNHGSFGGCPHTVLAAAADVRSRLEASPMRFFVLEWQTEVDRARVALAAFVNAPAERLVFVPGSTTGVALALHSIPLAAGDEVIVTDHAYRACRNQLERLATARGLRIATVHLPLPFDPDAAIEAIDRAITPHTRLALLDHITSPTALRLPLEAIVPRFAERGIPTVVDGAHAPGQLALDVTALGATYYVGNCHKWLCAPKAAGFVAVAEAATLHPLVTSHGASAAYGSANRLHAELDWSGTYDPSAQLAVPAAIETIAHEGGGWRAVLAQNHALALAMRDRIVEELGCTRIAPDSALGSMAAIPIALPAGVAPLALERELLKAGWEVPIVDFATGPFVRVSAHLYNHVGEAEALARELRARGVTSR
jgi:isopenicillin-N epimerase